MKKTISILTAAAVTGAAVLVSRPPTPKVALLPVHFLSWRSNETNVTFNVYRAAQLPGPFVLWTNVASTNVIFEATGSCGFFMVTATNYNGESLPAL